jgi:hypothetical protein
MVWPSRVTPWCSMPRTTPPIRSARASTRWVAILHESWSLMAYRTAPQDQPLSLERDLVLLREGIREHQAVIVVVDPLTAYLGGVDTAKDGAIRPAVTALNRLAIKERVTVIALIHLNKAQQMDALYRVSGSLAFISIPRVAYLLGKDPKDDERRVLASLKFNIGPAPSPLAYRIGAAGCFGKLNPARLERGKSWVAMNPREASSRSEASSRRWTRPRLSSSSV